MKRLPDYNDPQNAPEYYIMELRRVTDTEGVEWHLVIDNDGERFLLDDCHFVALPQGYLGSAVRLADWPEDPEWVEYDWIEYCAEPEPEYEPDEYFDEDMFRRDR